MRLKNVLLAVSDIEKSKRFYQDLFGLNVVRDFGENLILTEGLVLQEKKIWEQLTCLKAVSGNASELFFEENDFDAFLDSIKLYPEKITIVSDVSVNSWGRRTVMLKDPDGHLIEVAEITHDLQEISGCI